MKRRKRYDGGDNPGGHAQSKGAAENAQEHSEGLEHCHDLKGVAVVSLRLVGHYGPENGKENTHYAFMAVEEQLVLTGPGLISRDLIK